MVKILNKKGDKFLPSVKKKWIAALESGNYQRARGYLYKGTIKKSGVKKMCCLGVLGDVMGIKMPGPERADNTNRYGLDIKTYFDFELVEPVTYDDTKKGSHEHNLADINDDSHTSGYTKQIEYIKKNL